LQYCEKVTSKANQKANVHITAGVVIEWGFKDQCRGFCTGELEMWWGNCLLQQAMQ